MQVSASDIRTIIEGSNIVKNMSSLQDGTTFRDAGVDSLDVFSILLAVEEHYGIKIPDEELDSLNCIEAIASYLQKQ